MMPVNSETAPETDIAETLSQNTGNQIMRDKFDELAYTFWSIHPKDIPVDGTMPDNHPGGLRAWFYAQEMRAALPDMVVPLRWEKPCQANTRCHIARAPAGDYYVDVCGGRHQAWMESYTKPYKVEIGEPVGNIFEAKKVAQAHHVAQVLSAFGITPPSTREDT